LSTSVLIIQHNKPHLALAASSCHVANNLMNFTGDRQTNKQTDELEEHHHCIKLCICEQGFTNLKTNQKMTIQTRSKVPA